MPPDAVEDLGNVPMEDPSADVRGPTPSYMGSPRPLFMVMYMGAPGDGVSRGGTDQLDLGLRGRVT